MVARSSVDASKKKGIGNGLHDLSTFTREKLITVFFDILDGVLFQAVLEIALGPFCP